MQDHTPTYSGPVLHLPRKPIAGNKLAPAELERLLELNRQFACATNPEIREFFARRYTNLTGYRMQDFRNWLAAMFVVFDMAEGKTEDEKIASLYADAPGAGTSASSVKSNVYTCLNILACRIPFFAVDRGLMKDLLAMEPTHDWNIDHEAALLFPAYALLLPDDLLKVNGVAAHMLTVTLGEMKESADRILLVNVHFTNTMVLHSRSRVKPDGTVVFENDIDKFDAWELDNPEQTRSEVEALAIGTYLAMAITCTANSSFGGVVRGLLTKGTPDTKKHQTNGKGAWFAPTITAERLVQGHPGAGTGHGGPRRAHVRRAHWHTVRHGEGFSLRKKIRYPMSYVSASRPGQ